MKTSREPGSDWRQRRGIREGAFLAGILSTIAFVRLKASANEPILGLSPVFDYFCLALLWVFVGWVLGVFRTAVPERGEIALDRAEWALDVVRSQGLPDSHAGIPGGLFLRWLIRRDALSDRQPPGSGESSVIELYEAFGEKLLAGDLRASFRSFAKAYLAAEDGAYLDDLVKALGSDFLTSEPDEAALAEVEAVIDRRWQDWCRRSVRPSG
ncbi:MAG: hypothetical protein AAF604_19230 [Acidobacteriota bacterium]